MGTTRKRKTELADVQGYGSVYGRPFHYGQFWQACGKAGPESQYTGVYARRGQGKRWGEIVVQWDDKETRIGTFERVKGKDGEHVWMGRLELTGEWSRLPRKVRIEEAYIRDPNEDHVRDYLVDTAVEYFVSCGRPETKYTTTGKVYSDGLLEVTPINSVTDVGRNVRKVSSIDYIDAFNPYVGKLPILEMGSSVGRSTIRSHVVVESGATVSKSTVNRGCVVNGYVDRSYLGSRVWVSENASLTHATIGDEVRIGKGGRIEGTEDEKVEIYPPEVHIPAEVELIEKEGISTATYLVLGPIGGSSLTAVRNADGTCVIQFGSKRFTLAELVQFFEKPTSMLGHPLHKSLRMYDQYSLGQLEALLPLLQVSFPNGD